MREGEDLAHEVTGGGLGFTRRRVGAGGHIQGGRSERLTGDGGGDVLSDRQKVLTTHVHERDGTILCHIGDVDPKKEKVGVLGFTSIADEVVPFSPVKVPSFDRAITGAQRSVRLGRGQRG